MTATALSLSAVFPSQTMGGIQSVPIMNGGKVTQKVRGIRSNWCGEENDQVHSKIETIVHVYLRKYNRTGFHIRNDGCCSAEHRVI
jgi:hypothetical protein